MLLDDPALGVRPVEDGQVAPAVVLLVVQVVETVGHPLGLVGLVVGVVAEDLLTRPLLGPQVLGLAPEVVGDDGVGGVQDALGGPVVLVEDHDGGVGEGFLELEDVADVGAPELVDRLVGVPDHADVPVLLAQQDDELVLGPVGVLVLVDQHVLEALLVLGQHVGGGLEQPDGVDQEVVEVHGPGPLESGLVLAVDVGDPLLGRRRDQAGVLVDADQVVLGRADGGVHRPGGEPLGVDVQVPEHVAGEADGVGLVVDGEARRVAQAVGAPAQDADAGRVEGRDPHLLGHRPDQGPDPRLHLGRGLVGEGDGDEAEGRDAPFLDQVGDAVGQHPGLARTGPSDDEQWAITVDDGLPLRGVQPLEELCVRRHPFTLPTAPDTPPDASDLRFTA